MPSAPGKLPKRLSNVWFSIMISMTCLMGKGVAEGLATAEDARVDVAPVAAATRSTSPATRNLLCFM
jgi:hypothetical protein